MQLSIPRPVIATPFGPRDHDGRIIIGYTVLAIVVLAAIYLASGTAEVSEADIATAIMFR